MNQNLITTVRHPRSEYPETAWTGFITEVLAPAVIEVRMPARPKSFDVRTLSQPTPDWIGGVLGPPAPPFDPVNFPPSDFATKQYRQPKADLKVFETQPNHGWFTGVQRLFEAEDTVAPNAQRQAYRARGRPLTAIDTNRDLPWLSRPLNLWEVHYQAAPHSEMQSYRPPKSQQPWPPWGEPQEFAYLRQTIPPAIETFVAIKQLLDSFEVRARHGVRDTDVQDAWIFNSIPVPFDVTATVAAIYELINSLVPGKSQQRESQDFVQPFAYLRQTIPPDVATFAAVQQLGVLPVTSFRRPIPTDPDSAWIKENLVVAPAFDQALMAAMHELYRGFVPKNWVRWYDVTPQAAWMGTLAGVAFDPKVLAAIYQLLGEFLPPKSTRPLPPLYHDVAWIKENLGEVLRRMKTKNWFRSR